MKLLTKFLLAASLFGACISASAQSNQPATDSMPSGSDLHLAGFDAIKIQGPFNVYIVQGNEESVKMDAPAEIRDRIVADVSGGELTVRNKFDFWPWGEYSVWNNTYNNWMHNVRRAVVYITVKNVDAIKVSGSANVFFSNGVASAHLKLRVRGSGRMEGKLDAKELMSRISGSGYIKLSGNAVSSGVHISGSGHFSGRELVTAESYVHISGSGHAEVNANQKIEAATRGSSHVSYTGNASVVNASHSGSGSINKM